MNNFRHDNPGQSIFHGSDLANIQVNNDSQDENEDHLDKQRLDQELKMELEEKFNESGANMSVLSSSHCSDASEDELESNISHSLSSDKPKSKRNPIFSNPAVENLQHYVNKNFQPDFHKDGSYPSPIPQYSSQNNKHITSNEAAQNISKQYVYEGLSNEASYETLQALYEMRRSEVSRLEKELDEYKMQAEADIDNLRKNLLINESESQRIIVEYQQQCENLKEKTQLLEEKNFNLKQSLEKAEKLNVKKTKELENIRVNKINLEEQLINISRNNASKQYDTNVDVIVNDLKKRHAQEVVNLQDQYKSVYDQLKSKDRHCVLLTNDLKKLQEEHHRVITENNNLIGKLTTDLNELQKNKLSNPQNYDDILNLKSQLKECFKQNQQLNNTLQNLTAENDKLRANLSASHSLDKHCLSNCSKLEEDYQKNLDLLQNQRDEVKKLTEHLSAKNRSIAELEKKEVAYKHCMHKIQQELEKYSRDKSHNGVHSNLECETLRNNLEMQLEDTMCKLIRTEEDMSPLPKQVTEKNNSSIEEYMHYYQSSMENYSKQKEQEVENLKNRMEEYIKEIDELKQLYVKVCSEKETSLDEKQKLKTLYDEQSAQLEMIKKQYEAVMKEKEELAIAVIGMKKEMSVNEDPLRKQSLEKEIDQLKNELMMHKRQKEMIAQLKIDLAQSKERVLSLEQRLQSECNSKVASFMDQLNNLKKQYDEKVDELKEAKDTIFKLTNSDLRVPANVTEEEKNFKSKLIDYENLLANIERKHKHAINEITYKYKNELHELQIFYSKKCDEEKGICTKMIEELKSKHKMEIDTLNTVAKQKSEEYASQELIQIVAEHKQQFEKAKEILTLKNNTIKDLEMKLEKARLEISTKNSWPEQLKQLHENSADVSMLKEQIEEERSKFAQIMTNWAQEVRQLKDKLSATVAECEKLRGKYMKVKHAALGYKHVAQKQQLVYNDFLSNCVHFMDELQKKTDQLLTHREDEIHLALKEFENECKQRRLAFSDVNKLSSFNTS